MDTRPKNCEISGCKYAANYGDTVERTRRFCARHKLDGMFSYQDLVRLGDVRVLYSPATTDDVAHGRKLLDSKEALRRHNKTALLLMYQMEC